jgi:hypothetical protein
MPMISEATPEVQAIAGACGGERLFLPTWRLSVCGRPSDYC